MPSGPFNTLNGNWSWRFDRDQLPPDLGERLRRMARMYGRCDDAK